MGGVGGMGRVSQAERGEVGGCRRDVRGLWVGRREKREGVRERKKRFGYASQFLFINIHRHGFYLLSLRILFSCFTNSLFLSLSLSPRIQ